MTLVDLTQRLSRADLLDGIGVYVAPGQVALAHLRKQLWRVQLLDVAVRPLPTAADTEARRQAVVEAVRAFVGARRGGAVQRAYILVPRRAVVTARVVLPAAARDDLAQALEYQIENLVPLPKDEMHYEYVVAEQREERVEVLLACVPRAVVQEHVELLAQAGLRVRGIGVASTALADYVLFCRGQDRSSFGLLVPEGGDVEVALVRDGRYCASQVVPARRLPGGFESALARQFAEEQVDPATVPLMGFDLPPAFAERVALRDAELLALAAGRLEDEGGRLAGLAGVAVPAIGAALAAIREQTVPLNLLPADQRRAAEEGPSLATLGLASLVGVLLLVFGLSVLVKDRLLLREVSAQLDALKPKVREVRTLQDELEQMKRQLSILTSGQDVRATRVLRDLTELVPKEAYLTTLTLRQGRVTMDGQATSASDLISKLEKSKRFRNVQFSSPTTRAGDKERFALSAEVAR